MMLAKGANVQGSERVQPVPPVNLAPPMPYPSALRAWSVIFLLLLAYCISLVDRQILSLMVQPVKRDLSLTDTELSLLVGFAFVIFYGSLALVLGRVADHRNRRNMVVFGMLLWSLATIGCGFAQNFQELFVARMLVGVGEAALSPAAYSLIADYFPPEKRSRPVSVYTIGVLGGIGGAFLFGGSVVDFASKAGGFSLPVVGAVASWQLAFMMVGLPGVVVALCMLLVREPVRRELTRENGSLRDLFRFLSENRFVIILMMAGYGLNGLINGSATSWLPALFIRTLGWTPGEVGRAVGLLLLTFGPSGVLFGGWWVGRAAAEDRARRTFATSGVALILMTPLVISFGLLHSATPLLVAIALLAFLLGLVFTLVPIAIYEVTPNQFRAQIVAVYLLVSTFSAFLVGVTLIAAVNDYVFRSEAAIGKSMALVLGPTPIAGALCFYFVIRRLDRDRAAG